MERLRVNPAFNTAAHHLTTQRNSLLERWRTAVVADENLPKQSLAFTIEELDDHLPALLETIVESLSGKEPSYESIRKRGAQPGRTRRIAGYSTTQVIWEFAVFRRLLREAVEGLHETPAESRFAVRVWIIEVADRSEVGSVQQYIDDANQERDAAREELCHTNGQRGPLPCRAIPRTAQ
jgi:hypothetical protein